MGEAKIEGSFDPRFARVREEFERNFSERGDIGAAVAVTLDGVPVVDLWGGWMEKEQGRPWQADTIVPVWSVGKAVCATALLRLVDRGLVEIDAPVARYWPEFAQAGKGDITIRLMLSHQAGLPGVVKPMPPGGIRNWDLMIEALELQEPWWEPGSRFGYHTNTFGFLVGEVVRRVDGRRIGQFIRDEIATPLGIDFLLGFGPEYDHRVATNIPYQAPPGEETQRPWLEKDPKTATGIDLARILAYRNPPPDPPGTNNVRASRASEVPGTNPHSNARAMARIFGALSRGGEVDGYRLLSEDLCRQARVMQSDGEDTILGRPNRFGLGFQLSIPGVRPLGPSANAFGHYGAGAILGFADPDTRLGFGYVLNKAGRSWRDPRNIALVDAMYESLG